MGEGEREKVRVMGALYSKKKKRRKEGGANWKSTKVGHEINVGRGRDQKGKSEN